MKKILVKLVYVFAITALLISCGKDDDTYNYQNPTEQGGNNNYGNEDNEGDDEENISEIIADNVSVNITYQHFRWKIKGNTYLASALPDRQIDYRIYFGYTDMPTIFYRDYSITGNSFEYFEPVYIENIFHMSLDLTVYLNLLDKPNLTDEEQDLFNSVRDVLMEHEYEVKSSFWGQFVVIVDGEEYIVKEW